jgi:HSP20 family molecular chaperone IbpA
MNTPNKLNTLSSPIMNISLVPKNNASSCYVSYTGNAGNSFPVGKTRLDAFWPIDLWTSKWPDLFDQFDAISSPQFNLSRLNPWKENGDNFTYETELPRFRASSLDITTENGLLHIKAEQDSLKYYNSINLPKNADTDTVNAKLDHGVLYISILKLAAAKSKKIKVQTVK